MTTREKQQLWSLVLESQPYGRIDDDAAMRKSMDEAQKTMSRMLKEIGDGEPDFTRIREQLGL